MPGLNERQRWALLWLEEKTDPAAELRHDGAGVVMSWQLGDAMRNAALITEEQARRYRDKVTGCSISASRTLSSLRKRGLATCSTPGGEAFQSVVWKITDAGVTLAAELGPQPTPSDTIDRATAASKRAIRQHGAGR